MSSISNIDKKFVKGLSDIVAIAMLGDRGIVFLENIMYTTSSKLMVTELWLMLTCAMNEKPHQNYYYFFTFFHFLAQFALVGWSFLLSFFSKR